MKLLFSLTASPSESAEASYGTICIGEVAASQLLVLHAKVRAFLNENAGAGSLCEFFAPSFGWSGALFEALRYVEGVEAALGDKEVCEAPGDMSSPDEDDEVRMECHRVEFCENGVVFTALAKHGVEEYRTPAIPLDLLRAIAG